MNFFLLDERLRLVDLPGYGFAKASRSAARKFQNLGRAYLRGRPNLQAGLSADRRPPRPEAADAEALDALDQAAVSYQIVLTKADKLKAGEVDAVVGDALGRDRQAPGRLPARAGHLGGKGRWPRRTARRDRPGGVFVTARLAIAEAPADLRHVDTWLFDLDNTLYPSESGLWRMIEPRMTAFVMETPACRATTPTGCRSNTSPTTA